MLDTGLERSVSPFAKVRGAAGVPPNVSKVTVTASAASVNPAYKVSGPFTQSNWEYVSVQAAS